MGFGKARLMRAKMKATAAATEKRWPPYTANLFQLNTKDQTETSAVFLDEEPTFRQYHWPNGGRSDECTLSHPWFDGKCIYCHEHEKVQAENEGKDKSAKKDSSLYPRSQWIVQLLDLRYLHWVPHPKKENKDVVTACAHGEANVPTALNRCKWCKHKSARISERRFGGLRRWELGKTHAQMLFSYAERVKSLCVHEEGEKVCGGKTWVVDYHCPADGCDHVYFDDDDVMTKEEEVRSFVNDIQACPTCGAEDLPTPTYVCDKAWDDKTESFSHSAVPLELTQCLVNVECIGEIKKIRGKEQEVRSFNFKHDFIEDLPALVMGEFGLTEDEVAELFEPVDLTQVYKPAGLSPEHDDFKGDDDHSKYVNAVLTKQAENCGCPNPYSTTGSTQRSRPFGGKRFGAKS